VECLLFRPRNSWHSCAMPTLHATGDIRKVSLLARPRNPPKHRGISESRSHRETEGYSVFGSTDLTTRPLPAPG
jgi:hypothetical protein